MSTALGIAWKSSIKHNSITTALSSSKRTRNVMRAVTKALFTALMTLRVAFEDDKAVVMELR